MTIYFAWVDPGTTFDSGTHSVNDEQIRSFEISQDEGDFAKLTIEIKNPRVGPLSSGRKVWAWLSVDGTPLFYGRLIAIPSNILDEIITYVLLARPSDVEEQKQALAASLRVLPFYDEIFISEEHRDDPDAVLEGYSKLWHYDRIASATSVSVSDVLSGEDGTIVFGTSDVPYSSLNVQISRAPLQSVTVKGGIPWAQSASGTIDFGTKVIPTIQTAAMIDNWPKIGDSLAGGYYVVSASATGFPGHSIQNISRNFNWSNQAKKHRDGDTMSINESYSGPAGVGLSGQVIRDLFTEFVVGDPATGTPASSRREYESVVTISGSLRGTLVLGIEATRDRKDNTTLTVESGLQDVLKDPADTSTTEIIDLNGADVSQACGGDAPIGDAGRNEYITTDRGLQSLQYMLARARARLVMGSRVVDVMFDCRFSAAVAADLSLRKSGLVSDSRIPGGEALGKIVSYKFSGDGSSGKFIASIKMQCAPGLGSSLETSAGSGDYVSNDYVDPSYQTYIGAVHALDSGDISYTDPILVAGGGGAFFAGISYNDVVVRDEIVGDLAAQRQAIIDAISAGSDLQYTDLLAYYSAQKQAIAQAVAQTEMWWELELKNLTGAGIEAHYSITGDLVIPKQIDFTAA